MIRKLVFPLAIGVGLLLLGTWLILASLAADAPGSALPEKYQIELTPAEVQTISAGLLELPGKTGLPILQAIQGQLNKQIEDAKAKEPAK